MVSIVKVAVANLSSTASNSLIKIPVGSNTVSHILIRPGKIFSFIHSFNKY